jgi:hypothetical protein
VSNPGYDLVLRVALGKRSKVHHAWVVALMEIQMLIIRN